MQCYICIGKLKFIKKNLMKNLLTFILSVFSFTCFVSNVQAQVIEGKVYIDFNANGQLDTTEYGFGGIQIYLYEGCQTNSPILDSVRTNSVGAYQFYNLPLGMYSVKVNKSDPKSPTSSSSPSYCCLELISTSNKEPCNFGYPPPTCTSNPFSVENLCEMAYSNPLCDLTVIDQFACGQNPSILGPWKDSLHCGGRFQNTSFYGFIAGSGNYVIEFEIFVCAGTGVEYGLMDTCNPSGPYQVCSGNANTGTVTIPCSNLIPGKTYVFWLDGYQGSVCAYFIQVKGDFNYFEIPDVNDIKVQGLSENECNPAGIHNINFDLAPSYTFAKENVSAFWEVKSPDGEIEKFTTYTDRFDTLSYNFTQTGSYEICVYTDNSCSLVGNYFCKEFEIDIKQSEPPIGIIRKDFCLNDQDFVLEAVNNYTGVLLQNVIWSGVGIDSFGSFNPSITGIGNHEIYLEVEIGACIYNDTVLINVRDGLIGDNCDDKDSTTVNDVIQPDCTCKGKKVSSTNDFKDFGLSIIPNPSKDKFIIKSLLNENVEIKVVNINGQFCTNINKFVLNENQIDVSTWASGMYYVLVKTKNDVTALKFIKVE
jgi:hypothetical protein